MPSWWWLLVLGLVGSLALAVLAYVPLAQGLVVVVLFALAVILVVFAYGHTAVRVLDGALHVGRYTVQGRWIAGVEALDRGESTAAMTTGANTSDFLVTRPYIGSLVRIELNDAADSHPHWLISSRRAVKLAAAVESIMQGRA